MSKVIDTRVVEMQFDNSRFEKNVAESMSTLEKLKAKLKGLDDSSDALDQVGKAAEDIDLSKLDKSLETITNRFSTMGIVGMTAIEDLTKSAMNMVKSFGSNIWNRTIGQIKAGGKARAANIESSKFLLEGMGITFNKTVEDQISEAVTDTAFGFDEAAMAMAQLSGAGVQLGDDMKQALKAISGVAAMTQRSFSDIADIFVDSAAAGKVAGDAFNRLGERGLGAKQIMMDFYGVTSDELDKLARGGMISFNDFSKAMYDAFGTQAKKANDTLEGVLANINSALSRIGAIFYQPLLANNSDIVHMLNSFKKIISDFKTTLVPTAKIITDYILSVARGLKRWFDTIKILDKDGNLTDLGKKFETNFTNIANIIINVCETIDNLRTNFIAPLFKEIQKAFFDVFPELNTGKSMFASITEAILELTKKMREASKHIGIFGEKGSRVRSVFRAVFSVLRLIYNILELLAPLIDTVSSAAIVGITAISNLLSNLVKNFGVFVQKFKMIGSYIVSGIAYGIFEGIPYLFRTITNFVESIINKFRSLLIIHSPSALAALVIGLPIAMGIGAGILMGKEWVVKKLKDFITSVFDSGAKATNQTASVFSKIFSIIGEINIEMLNLIAVSIKKIAEAISMLDATKLFEHINDINRFLVLGTLVIITLQLLKASTWFSTAMYNFSRALKIYIFGKFSFWSKLPDMFESFALSVAILTACVIILGKLPVNEATDGLVRVGILVSGLIGTLLLMGALVEVIEGFDRVTMIKIGVVFFAIASAITAMALGTYLLKDVPIDVVIGVMITMAASIAGLSWAINQFSVAGNGKTAIAYVLSMSLFINAFGKLCLMLAFIPEPLIIKATAVLAALTLMLIGSAGLLILASKLNTGTYGEGSLAGVAASFLSMAASLFIIVGVMRLIANEFTPEELERGVVTVLGIMGFMAIMIGVVNVTASIGGAATTTLLGAALAIGAMGVVIALVAQSIHAIGNMDQDEVDRAGRIILQIMALVIVETAAMIFTAKAVGLALAGLAALVASFAVTIKLIGEMESGVDRGVAALLGILFLCGVINGFISRLVPADYNPAYKMFLGLAAMVAACAGFIYVIGKMSWEEMTRGTIAATAILIGLRSILDVLNKGGLQTAGSDKNLKSNIKLIKQIAKTVILLTAALALIGIALTKFSDDPMEAVIDGGIALAIAIGGMYFLLQQLSMFRKDDLEKISKLAEPIRAMTGAILAIAGAVSLLTFVVSVTDPLAVWTAAGVIALVMLSIDAIIQVCRTTGATQNVKWGGIVASIFAIITIAAAITVLTTLIADKGWTNVGNAVLSLVGVLGMILLSLVVLQKYKVDFGACLALVFATTSLLIAAAAFGILLDQLGNRDWVALDAVATSMFLTIATVVGGMAAIALLMKKLNPGYVVGSVIILGGLCWELTKVAEALKALVGYDWAQIWPALAGMGIAIAGIVTIAGIVGAISLTGGGLAAFALGLLVLAGAIAELAWVSKILVDASNAVKTFGQALTTYFSQEAMNEFAAAMEIATNSVVTNIQAMAKAIADNGVLAVAAAYLMSSNIVAAVRTPVQVNSQSPLFTEIGLWIPRSLAIGISSYTKSNSFLTNPVLAAIKMSLGVIEAIRDTLDIHSFSELIGGIGEWIPLSLAGGMDIRGWVAEYNAKILGSNIVQSLKAGMGDLLGGKLKERINAVLKDITSGISLDIFGDSTAANGGFTGVIDSVDFSKLISGEMTVQDIFDQLGESGLTAGSMSGDAMSYLAEQMKEAGVEGEQLNEIMSMMGATQEDLKKAGIDVSGMIGSSTDAAVDSAKAGAAQLSDLASRIIKGEFKNAPERWDLMYSKLIAEGKTAQEAYAAIADAQNEVNTKYGSKVVHTADEIARKISDTVKKANAEAAKLNEDKKGKTEEKLTGKDKLAEEKEKQVALRDEQKKTATELTKQLEAQKLAIKKSIEMDDGKTEALVEEYNKLLAQKEAIDRGTESQKASTEAAEETGKTVAQNAVSQNKVADATKEATEAQKKQTEAVKETTEAQKEQLRIKEQLEKPTHSTKSDSVKYGSKEYEDLKSGMGVNTKTTDRDARFGVTTTRKAVQNTWNKETAKDLNLKPLGIDPKVENKFQTSKLHPIKQETENQISNYLEKNPIEIDVSKGFGKQEEIGNTIISTLFDSPAAKIVKHGNETYESLGKSCVNAFFKSLTEEYYARHQQIPSRLPEPMNGYVTPVDELYANAYETNKNKPQYSKFFSELDEAAKEAGASSSELYQYYFINGFDNTNMSIGEVGEKLKLKLLEESAKANGQAYQQGYKTYADYMKGSLDAMQQKSAEQAAAKNKTLDAKKDEALAKGKETGETFLKGVEAYVAMKNPVVALIDGFVKHKAEIDAKYQEGGESAVNKFTGGLNSPNIPDSKFRAPADRANRQIGSKEVRNAAYKDGENITLGVANGMTSPYALMQMNKAGTKVAATGDNAIRDYMKIKSPSRVTYDEGVYVVRGYVNGILASLGMVKAASSQIGSASLNAITPVVYGIQNAVQDGLDLTPVITPVINSSNIRTDLTAINDMLGQRHVASIEENFRATQDYKTLEAQNMQTRMSGMQDAINMLSAAMLNQPTPEVTANVVLQGDAGGVFRVVRQEDLSYRKMHGKSAFG